MKSGFSIPAMAMAIIVLLPILFPTLGMAEPLIMEPAHIILERPDGWKELSKETYPNAPSNVCFPRLQKDSSRIDAVIWKDAASLDEALDQYIDRLPRLIGNDRSFKEIQREPFKAASGIEGILYRFETTEATACGPYKCRFSRYVFRNSKGRIVCMGGVGDLNEIHRIILASLAHPPRS